MMVKGETWYVSGKEYYDQWQKEGHIYTSEATLNDASTRCSRLAWLAVFVSERGGTLQRVFMTPKEASCWTPSSNLHKSFKEVSQETTSAE